MTNNRFGYWSMVALVVASMIGVGVYTTSGFALGALQSRTWVLAAWMIAGVIAMCGAVGYGALAKQITENGGEYLYLSRKLHPIAGVLAGWVSFVGGFSGAGAAAALGFAKYMPLDQWIGMEASRWGAAVVAALLVLTATILQAGSHRAGTGSQNALVFGKLIAIASFIVIAAFLILRSPTAAFPEPFEGDGVSVLDAGSVNEGGEGDGAENIAVDEESDGDPVFWQILLTQVMWISFSYTGFNAAIYVAGDSGNGSLVARSMVTATAIVTLIYLALNAVFVFSAPVPALAGSPDVAAIAASQLGGDRLEWPVRLMIGVGLATSVFSVLIAGPRVYTAMARNRAFPKWFDDPRNPPARSVWMQGLVMIGLVFASELVDLVQSLAIVLSLSAAMTVATVLVSRKPTDRPQTREKIAASIYSVATIGLAMVASFQFPDRAKLAISIVAFGTAWYVFDRWMRPTRSNAAS